MGMRLELTRILFETCLCNVVEMIKIPSIMGSDDYSDYLMTGSKAGAVINIFEEGKGRTTQYNIILN